MAAQALEMNDSMAPPPPTPTPIDATNVQGQQQRNGVVVAEAGDTQGMRSVITQTTV